VVVSSEQPALIADQLVALARTLGLVEVTDATGTAVSQLLGVLRSWERWLLIFDNAEDPRRWLGVFPVVAGMCWSRRVIRTGMSWLPRWWWMCLTGRSR
jgi:hypothetical protein